MAYSKETSVISEGKKLWKSKQYIHSQKSMKIQTSIEDVTEVIPL